MCARVLLGVTGGIAAYKSVELVRLLQAAGHDVTVLQTRASREFVGSSTFAALTGRSVITDESEWSTSATGDVAADAAAAPDPATAGVFPHLDAAREHDLFVVAPATANMLGRLAGGIADDVLSSAYLAFEGPVVVAPAMNTRMWQHPATRRNLETLEGDGVVIVQPAAGLLACGEVGAGRLAPVEEIAGAIEMALGGAPTELPGGDYTGLTVLVTAGGTREPIDDVRFITNRSSGRMGVAIAHAARDRGARVQLVVTGSVDRERFADLAPEAVVDTAAELGEVVDRLAPGVDVVVMAAAVSDFTVERVDGKLPRGDQPRALELVPTRDILGDLGATRSDGAGPMLIGFAAESGAGGVERAQGKLARKRIDMIIHNDVARSDIGFEAVDNQVTIITGATSREVGPAPKRAIADAILDDAIAVLRTPNSVLR